MPDIHARFVGGLLDGTTIHVDADLTLPNEIVFRETQTPPYREYLYRLDMSELLNLSLPVVESTVIYRLGEHTELARLVHDQARMIICLEDEKRRLEKAVERLNKQLASLRRGGRRSSV